MDRKQTRGLRLIKLFSKNSFLFLYFTVIPLTSRILPASCLSNYLEIFSIPKLACLLLDCKSSKIYGSNLNKNPLSLHANGNNRKCYVLVLIANGPTVRSIYCVAKLHFSPVSSFLVLSFHMPFKNDCRPQQCWAAGSAAVSARSRVASVHRQNHQRFAGKWFFLRLFWIKFFIVPSVLELSRLLEFLISTMWLWKI